MSRNKRPRHDDSPSQSSPRYKHSAASPSHVDRPSRSHDHPPQPTSDPRAFPSVADVPNLPPKLKLLCEIVAGTPSLQIEAVLDDAGVRVSPEDVEQVLKLSYASPASAVKFFRWVGYQLGNRHSPYSWNLVVDLLGRNGLFEAMWDAVQSMRKEGLLSLATFASVFGSYAAADRGQEAIMAFEVMDRYGCARDIVALNSLLSALCRERKTATADEFFRAARAGIQPDADAFAILLEGWEGEGDAAGARRSFGEMVATVGWNPGNVAAYDSYLCTLLKDSSGGVQEAMRAFDGMRDRGCLPGSRFLRAALEECARAGDDRAASSLWCAMAGRGGCKLDTDMYNYMINLWCSLGRLDAASGLLDGMVCDGAFPDSQTYNLLLRFLIEGKRLPEVAAVFAEMVKNEFTPSLTNCCAAVEAFIQGGDLSPAVKVWKWMVENHRSGLEETGNVLVVGLREGYRIPEALKYAEDMVERGIRVFSSTLSKLKQSLSRTGKMDAYEVLLRKWKMSPRV